MFNTGTVRHCGTVVAFDSEYLFRPFLAVTMGGPLENALASRRKAYWTYLKHLYRYACPMAPTAAYRPDGDLGVLCEMMVRYFFVKFHINGLTLVAFERPTRLELMAQTTYSTHLLFQP